MSKLTASSSEKTSNILYLRGTMGPGSYRHYTVLTEMMEATGKHRCKLVFKRRLYLKNFIINMIKPFAPRLVAAERHILTHWLRNNNFTIREIENIYLCAGLMKTCNKCGRPGYLHKMEVITHLNESTYHYQNSKHRRTRT